MNPKSDVTFCCFMLAVWSSLCIWNALHGNWIAAVFCGFFIAFDWTNLWHAFDACEKKPKRKKLDRDDEIR